MSLANDWDEPPRAECAFGIDWHQRIAGVFDSFKEISLETLCPREFA